MMLKKVIFLFIKIILFSIFLFFNNCTTKSSTNSLNQNITENNDPWESINRGTHSFNLTFDKYLLSPLAKGYRLIFPAELRPLKLHITAL